MQTPTHDLFLEVDNIDECIYMKCACSDFEKNVGHTPTLKEIVDASLEHILEVFRKLSEPKEPEQEHADEKMRSYRSITKKALDELDEVKE